MRYLVLAVDYDGTAAMDDRLSDSAALAIVRLRISGRRTALVTGRRLDDLLRVCPIPTQFVERLRERGVTPIEVGKVLVATHNPHRSVVFDVVCELGLELQVIINRSAIMVLPAGINKATGLQFALRKLGLSRQEAVAIGDAQNDHSLLMFCECGVAVANAVASLQDIATFVTRGANGSGVAELIDELITNGLRALEGMIERHLILVGQGDDGAVRIPPYGRNILIAGPSGSGKSTLTAGLVERLIEKAYQVCIIDPEGDYSTLDAIVSLGTQKRAPSVNEVLSILEDPAVNVSVNLLGLSLEDRPFFFSQLIPGLQALRARTGRPHWIVLDEAHHMLPQTWGHASETLPSKLGETILVTVHPDHVAPAVLAPIDVVFAVGDVPQKTLGKFAAATGQRLAWPQDLRYESGKVIAWFVSEARPPFSMQPQPGHAERIRHHRKYAEGNMRYHSFYFRGPDDSHNLRAQNLNIFCQIANGIDERTWMFHLKRGDYSRWFRDSVKDSHLAEETGRIERRTDLTSLQTRQLSHKLVAARTPYPNRLIRN